MPFLLLIVLSIVPALATLEKISIQNLDLNYASPMGGGEFEKLTLGIKSKEQTYPVEIHRRDHSIEILSPFISFEWMRPLPFVHNLQTASTKQLSLKLDWKEQLLSAEALGMMPQKGGEFIFKNVNLKCLGNTDDRDPLIRLMYDCHEKMNFTVSQMELPFAFLTELAEELPPITTDEDLPANDFSLSLEQGDFYSYLRIKYIVRAYLKIWGHMQYEEEGKVLAIKVNLIKYGILPVTNLVMNQLQSRVNSPYVTINPPWIKIKLGNK